MIASLTKIQSPITRSIAAGSTAFAAATMISALTLASLKPGQDNAHKIAVWASLLSAGCGAVLGLVVGKGDRPEDTTPSATLTPSEPEPETIWKDWRNFVVARKMQESAEITSFYLKPQDGDSIPNFQPGQFLTIRLDIPEQQRPVIRTYSLSDYTDPPEYYRLSIKREEAPKGQDVPPGVASNFMHDRVEVGTVIPAKPPNGKFVLAVPESIPVVLISNGVGITPMVAMAKAATRHNPNRLVWFLHGARDGSYHALREEMLAVAQQNPNLRIHYRYSRPRPEDEGLYNDTGYVDAALIRDVVLPEIEQRLGAKDAEYFLCGSPSFMDSLLTGLQELGVPSDRVFFESFGKGMTKTKADVAPAAAPTGGTEVVFAKSGKTATWTADTGTLLEFAEANGLQPPFSCRQGICLTCMCRIEEGEVEYEEPPIGEPDEGSVLICVSKPKGDRVVLDV